MPDTSMPQRFVPTQEELSKEQHQAPWSRRVHMYEKRLEDAVEYMRRMYPRIGYIVDSFQIRCVLTEAVDTAAVTGDGTIYFNPYFMERGGWDHAENKRAPLDIEELVFLIFHEISHIIYDFHGRLEGKHLTDWNIAQDHIINWIAKKMGMKVINHPGFQPCMADWAKELWDEEAYLIVHSENEEKRQQNSKSQEGQSQEGQSQEGQSQEGQSQSGQSQSGQPQDGQSQSGQPQSGQPQSGQSQDGNSLETKGSEPSNSGRNAADDREGQGPSTSGEDSISQTQGEGGSQKSDDEGQASKKGSTLGDEEDYSPEETEERMTEWVKGSKGGYGTDKPDFDVEATEQDKHVKKPIDKELVQRALEQSSHIEDTPGRGTGAGGFDVWKGVITMDDNSPSWQHEILSRIHDMMLNSDENWQRPRVNRIATVKNLERRGMGRTFFADEEVELPPIVVMVDTSGSMGQKTLNRAAGNISKILSVPEVSKVRLIAFDTAPHVDEENLNSIKKLKLIGGGGSDVEEALLRIGVQSRTPLNISLKSPAPEEKIRIKKEHQEPGLVIIFSDLDLHYPEKEPRFSKNVLWVYTGIGEVQTPPPFGEVIRMYPKPKQSPFSQKTKKTIRN